MNKRLLLSFFLVLFSASLSGTEGIESAWAGERKLYSVHILKLGGTGKVYELDPTDGKTLNSKNISLSGSTVYGAFGLAADPTSGKLYTILVTDGLPFDAGSKRVLAILDPETGQASKIGVEGQELKPIRSLAIDGEGKLYGATSTNISDLVEIDKQNGTIKKVLLSLHSSGGPLDTAIGYNPADNTIYNVTGGGILEKVKLPSLSKTSQSTSGTNYGNAKALVYCPVVAGCPEGGFRLTANTAQMDATGDFWHPMDSNGKVGAAIRKLDHSTKGLAFFPPLQPVRGVASDFDGDSDSDIFWRHAGDGRNKLWTMADLDREAAGNVRKLGDIQWQVAAVSDMTGDGISDLLWRHQGTGANRLWTMDANSVVTGKALPGLPNTAWRLAGTGDFDGDGKRDIFWHNGNSGANQIWLMDAEARLDKGNLPKFASTKWEPQGVADFTGDGRAEILWRQKANGKNRIWTVNKFNRTANAAIPTLANSDWAVRGLADHDGDGKADILWRNPVTGNNQIWLMDGSNRKAKSGIPRVGNQDWEIRGTGDYNGSGKADILWRNLVNGRNKVWQMDGFTRLQVSRLPRFADSQWEAKQ